MHISTHHDRIWQAGCQEKENYIIKKLTNISTNAQVCVVDAVPDKLLNNKSKIVITDNQFQTPPDCNIIDISPEFWHIYLCAINPGGNIKHQFNCLMNRISGERLLLLYNIKRRNLLDYNIVSFNCLYHDQNPTIEQRKSNFDSFYRSNNLEWNDIHCQLRNNIPLLTSYDPDLAAAASYYTIVVESYNHDNTIAFSEKIFRALQTARPWLLFGSPGSIKCLRNFGFDVLDDCVDHGYDDILDLQLRINLILDQCEDVDWNYERYIKAAKHNQQLLLEYQYLWPSKLEKICNYLQ